mmetsp:Transcript_23481/g.31108  ORF Transcript_23481/g.31108 Transcript_23481/m.31108 type:complete len:104 (-) Transcript_23481:108-419(-)
MIDFAGDFLIPSIHFLSSDVSTFETCVAHQQKYIFLVCTASHGTKIPAEKDRNISIIYMCATIAVICSCTKMIPSLVEPKQDEEFHLEMLLRLQLSSFPAPQQ